ncbi:hypothetical protein MAPG_05221 [Magnaporthiopsis poae ATCC 64411]|uniref:Uncharacterized protein n=1 Tax=Magnaporthiopsis poae (strain ATCC 64411 / 73-15) TaxID=644358 RepID=A0A0C4DYU2_MAGP6|nr:hypothetical protein MAPG_05221 [Magnaporthiopsis poae ATCC 64411]
MGRIIQDFHIQTRSSMQIPRAIHLRTYIQHHMSTKQTTWLFSRAALHIPERTHSFRPPSGQFAYAALAIYPSIHSIHPVIDAKLGSPLRFTIVCGWAHSLRFCLVGVGEGRAAKRTQGLKKVI